jgi:hypothetical protein
MAPSPYFFSLISLKTTRTFDVRLPISWADPLETGLKRLYVGPSSTITESTINLSAVRLLLFSAFAIALSKRLPINLADFLQMHFTNADASEAGFPRSNRETSLIFFAEILMRFNFASIFINFPLL